MSKIKRLLEHYAVNEIIRKRGDKWVVLTKDGSKVLGTHDSESAADKQLQAIHISQSKQK